MYYNARYYDPEIGQFISPDPIVPDPGSVFAYNRYMYVYGNPLKYHDSSGNVPEISVGGDIGGLSIYPNLVDCLGSLTCERTMVGQWIQEHPSYRVENDPFYGQHEGYTFTVTRAYSQMALDNGDKDLALRYFDMILSDEGWVDMAIIDGSFAAMQVSGNAMTALFMKPQWTPHGYKHFAPPNRNWKEIVRSTRSGPAKYLPNTDIEALERRVWKEGTPTTNGRDWRVIDMGETVGASGGRESRWIRVEYSGGTIHGHPITQQEYQRLIP